MSLSVWNGLEIDHITLFKLFSSKSVASSFLSNVPCGNSRTKQIRYILCSHSYSGNQGTLPVTESSRRSCYCKSCLFQIKTVLYSLISYCTQNIMLQKMCGLSIWLSFSRYLSCPHISNFHCVLFLHSIDWASKGSIYNMGLLIFCTCYKFGIFIWIITIFYYES